MGIRLHTYEKKKKQRWKPLSLSKINFPCKQWQDCRGMFISQNHLCPLCWYFSILCHCANLGVRGCLERLGHFFFKFVENIQRESHSSTRPKDQSPIHPEKKLDHRSKTRTKSIAKDDWPWIKDSCCEQKKNVYQPIYTKRLVGLFVNANQTVDDWLYSLVSRLQKLLMWTTD